MKILEIRKVEEITRFFIGGDGPIETAYEKTLGTSIVFGLSALAMSILLQAVSAILWMLLWIPQFL